jgi:hypothetical protein
MSERERYVESRELERLRDSMEAARVVAAANPEDSKLQGYYQQKMLTYRRKMISFQDKYYEEQCRFFY